VNRGQKAEDRRQKSSRTINAEKGTIETGSRVLEINSLLFWSAFF
jgi:hypothetical protein